MNFDSHFSERVSKLRNALGLTQSELANQVGIVQRQIAAYEAGDSKPRDAVLIRLARALGTKPGWLANGGGNAPELNGFIPYTSMKQVPLLEIGPYADKFHEVLTNTNRFHPCNTDVSSESFAMIIQGRSMVGSGGFSFPPGSIVIFDPAKEPEQGSFVLYAYEEEMAFTQYFSNLFQVTLKSLNKDYSDIVLDKGEGKILATAVYAEFRLP